MLNYEEFKELKERVSEFINVKDIHLKYVINSKNEFELFVVIFYSIQANFTTFFFAWKYDVDKLSIEDIVNGIKKQMIDFKIKFQKMTKPPLRSPEFMDVFNHLKIKAVKEDTEVTFGECTKVPVFQNECITTYYDLKRDLGLSTFKLNIVLKELLDEKYITIRSFMNFKIFHVNQEK